MYTVYITSVFLFFKAIILFRHQLCHFVTTQKVQQFSILKKIFYYYIKHRLKCLNTCVILSYTEKNCSNSTLYLRYNAIYYIATCLSSIYIERLILLFLIFLFHDTILKFNFLSKFIVYFREQGPRRCMLLATIFFIARTFVFALCKYQTDAQCITNKVILSLIIIIMLFIIFPIIPINVINLL